MQKNFNKLLDISKNIRTENSLTPRFYKNNFLKEFIKNSANKIEKSIKKETIYLNNIPKLDLNLIKNIKILKAESNLKFNTSRE